MLGERVDGNDVEAVFAAVDKADARARRGAGPSLLECVTHRWEGHFIFTRTEVRPREEIEQWKSNDPIDLVSHTTGESVRARVKEAWRA